MTNQVVVNRFLNEQRRSGKAVLTLSAYATDLKQFSSLLSPLSLSSLSPAKLNDLRQKWTAGLSLNAAARKLTTLRSFLGWSFQKGYIKKDLSASVFRPKRKTVSPAKPLTASQIARLRKTATIQERLLMELILQTGMRLPEVLAIKMKHLRMPPAFACQSPTSRTIRSRLKARSSAGRDVRGWTSDSRMPKGSDLPSGERSDLFGRNPKSGARIPISGILKQSLDYYLAAVTRGPRSYLLVSGRTGRPPGVRAAGMMLSKLGKRAGVRGVTPRNLRATFKMWMR